MPSDRNCFRNQRLFAAPAMMRTSSDDVPHMPVAMRWISSGRIMRWVSTGWASTKAARPRATTDIHTVKMNDDIAARLAFGKLTEKLVDRRWRLQSVMVRLPRVRDHKGDPKRGNQEQQQRGDVAAVVHPKAVVGLGEGEVAGKPGRNRCGGSTRESPSHRGENDRQQIADPDQIGRKKRSHSKQRRGRPLRPKPPACP